MNDSLDEIDQEIHTRYAALGYANYKEAESKILETKEKSIRLLYRLIYNLKDRKGFNDLFHEIDDETLEEMYEELLTIIKAEL